MSKYAGFWKRLAAILIDGLVTSIPPAVLLGRAINEVHYMSFLVYLAYSVWMLGMYGATIGKMIMKIKVVKEDGNKVSYSDAFVRELSKILSGLALCLGYLWMLWDKKKQTWHDKIAKTVVVKA